MKEITEDYVSFETRKLLLKKGMPEALFNHIIYDKGNLDSVRKYYSCSLNIAMKWLRVTYGYYIWVDYSRFDFDKNHPFLWNVVKAEIDGDYYGGTYHKTYEKAVESAIKYCLENLI